VPLVARWPGRIEPGGVTDHLSAFCDFLPTACRLAGLPPPADIDGLSYLPTLLGNRTAQKQHEYLYWEFRGKQAVRMGKWKAVRPSPAGKIELFDLETDLGEEENVAALHLDVVRRMQQIMRSAHAEPGRPPG
jgi:arylsulfatase A